MCSHAQEDSGIGHDIAELDEGAEILEKRDEQMCKDAKGNAEVQ